MPRGRPRKASNVLELTGAFKANPDRKRARENEPQPRTDGLLDELPPAYMTKEQRKCYREIVRGAHTDTLTTADGPWVEIVACLLSEYRYAPTLMKVSKLARLQAGLSQLGMSPSDRSKASAVQRKRQNRFAEFAA